MKKSKLFKQHLTLLVAMMAVAVVSTTTAAAQSRERISFNSDWRFTKDDPEGTGDKLSYTNIKAWVIATGAEFAKNTPSPARPEGNLGVDVVYTHADFDDSGWRSLNLPHDWGIEGPFKQEYPGGTGRLPWWGVGWYRKHFTLPSNLSGRRVFIEFEGARQAAEVYVNGTWVGRHENGVSAFGFDITDHVEFESTENVLAVKVDSNRLYEEVATGSTFQWQSSDQWGQTFGFNANYGGIPRNVYLHVTDPVYQSFPLYSSMGTIGTYVYASNFDISGGSATINVECQVKNSSPNSRDLNIQVDLVDMDGNQVMHCIF